MKPLIRFRSILAILVVSVVIICGNSTTASAQLSCGSSCPNTISPIEPVPPPWASSTGWNGPVYYQWYLGNCHIEVCYCWRVLDDGNGLKYYEASISSIQITNDEYGCDPILDLSNQIVNFLQNTAITNASSDWWPCDYGYLRVVVYRPCCWKWFLADEGNNTWSGANGFWRTCSDAARCKISINMCYSGSVVHKTNVGTEVIGDPGCDDFDPETFDPDYDGYLNPITLQPSHVSPCYKLDCSFTPIP